MVRIGAYAPMVSYRGDRKLAVVKVGPDVLTV